MTDLAREATLRALQHGLSCAGWEVCALDVNTVAGKLRIELRSGDRVVYFDVNRGRVSTTRETVVRDTVRLGRPGDIYLADRVSTRLLGRTRHDGASEGLRWLANYLADNSDRALTSSQARSLLQPILALTERKPDADTD